MAIGDLVKVSTSARVSWLRRFDSTLGAGITLEDIASERVFRLKAAPSAGAWRFWPRRLRWLGGGKALQPYSLKNLADVFHDIRIYGTGFGVEAVAVPFPHIAILAGSADRNLIAAIESDLCNKLKRYWDEYIDPIVDVRLRVFCDPHRDSTTVSAFMGRGIFLPVPGEAPIGRVELIKTDERGLPAPYSEPVVPAFPDGQAAGLYRGQSALVVSASTEQCPVTCPLVEDGGYIIVLDWSAPWLDENAQIHFIPAGNSNASGDILSAHPATPPDGYDEAHVIQCNGRPVFIIRVVRDWRRSRLRDAPPPNDPFYFEICGVLAPDENDSGILIDRWWIDVNAANRLVGSAQSPVARSIICRDDAIEAYGWATHSFAPVAGSEFRLDIARYRGRSRRVLRSTDQRGFGILQAPQQSSPAGFSANAAMGIYTLDWLDFAGAVETPNGYVRRLGMVNAEVQANGPELAVPGISNPVVASYQLLDPHQDAATQHVGVLPADAESGIEFVVGSLVLRARRNRQQ
jgi:hypothetical protein